MAQMTVPTPNCIDLAGGARRESSLSAGWLPGSAGGRRHLMQHGGSIKSAAHLQPPGELGLAGADDAGGALAGQQQQDDLRRRGRCHQ